MLMLPIFMVITSKWFDGNRFKAYEFKECASVQNLSNIPATFYKEFSEHIVSIHLVDILGLQFRNETSANEHMNEFHMGKLVVVLMLMSLMAGDGASSLKTFHFV